MVTSKGYSAKEEGEDQKKTSVLRHMIPHLDTEETALIEPIVKELFGLYNEYWVSFYVNGNLFDKKFIFVPETVIDDNLIYIKELDMDGVIHE